MVKKTGFITLMILSILVARAQQKVTHTTKVSFGIRGGVNFQNITGKDMNGDKLSNDILTGFNAGINLEIPIAPDFCVQPGLLYSLKGSKSKESISGQTINGTVKISYVEFPLNFLYKPQLGSGHLLLGFGPYIALGAGGTVKYEGGGVRQRADIKFKNKVGINNPDDVVYIRPLDAGGNILAGYEFGNKVSFQLNAQMGFTKINPEYEGVANDKTSAKNTGFGLSLGYRF